MGRMNSLKVEGRREIIVLPMSKIKKAPWNYKDKGSPGEIKRLAESIKRDKSAGVLPVRVMPGGVFESIDGNHRYEAIRLLKWKHVLAENFGKIDKAEAITIAQRRNHQWFADNPLKLGELMKNIVVPKISVDELKVFMPEPDKIEGMITLTEFDWSQYTGANGKQSEVDAHSLRLELSSSQYKVWNRVRKLIKLADKKIKTDSEVFKAVLIVYEATKRSTKRSK